MVKGYELASKGRRTEQAYFTSCVINYIIAAHAGKKARKSDFVSAGDLLKPFEPKKPAGNLSEEKDRLKQVFHI